MHLTWNRGIRRHSINVVRIFDRFISEPSIRIPPISSAVFTPEYCMPGADEAALYRWKEENSRGDNCFRRRSAFDKRIYKNPFVVIQSSRSHPRFSPLKSWHLSGCQARRREIMRNASRFPKRAYRRGSIHNSARENQQQNNPYAFAARHRLLLNSSFSRDRRFPKHDARH